MIGRRAIKSLLNRLGYDIHRIDREAGLRTSIEQSYILLRDLGFRPRTVVDVGVASGTPELYRTFPDAFFLLVEPLKQCEADLITILDQYKGDYVLAAAGARSGQTAFNVHTTHLAGSSLYKEQLGLEADGEEIVVPMITLDDVARERNLCGPYLMKVDVQGGEIDVLEGAQGVVSEAEAIVLEVSLFEFMKGAPQFYDVVAYMKRRGFVAFDIILGWNRPLDQALGQTDIVFVKEAGMFRKNHSYSTVEQMHQLCDS